MDAPKASYSIALMANVLGVTRAGYDAWKRRATQRGKRARLAQVGAGIDAEEGHNGIVVRGVVGGLVGGLVRGVVRGVAGGIVSSRVADVPADWFNSSIKATPRRVAQREVG